MAVGPFLACALALLLLVVQSEGQIGAALGSGAVGTYSRSGIFGEESASSLGNAPVGIYSHRKWSPKRYLKYPVVPSYYPAVPSYYPAVPYYKPVYPVAGYPDPPYIVPRRIPPPDRFPPRPRPGPRPRPFPRPGGPRPGPRPPRPGPRPGPRPPRPGRPTPPISPRSLIGGLLGGGGGLLGGLLE